MTIQIHRWSDLTLADATVLNATNLALIGGTVQPTSGSLWYWDAATEEPRRTLDTTGSNYVRDDMDIITTTYGMMRWFYWPGIVPTVIKYPMALRTQDPLDSLRAGFAITSAGDLRMIYNNSTQVISPDFSMTGMAAGLYAVEIQGDALTSGGTMKLWLYSNDLSTTHASLATTGLAYTAMTSFGRFRYGGLVADTGWTEDRLANGIISAAGETLTDNMLKTAWLASATTNPTLVLSRVDENIIDLTGSTAGSGGTLTFSVTHVSGANNSVDIIVLATGIFRVPRDATNSSTYRATVTESGTGFTDTEDFVVAPEGSGIVDSIRRRVWSGTAWV